MLKIKIIINSIILILIVYLNKINAKDVINILISRPDIGDNQFLENYNNLMNKYLSTNALLDFQVNFSYCNLDSNDGVSLKNLYKSKNSPYIVDEEYARQFNCTLKELKNSNYDLMIVDDRFFYSDNSYVDNTVLQSEFSYKKITDYFYGIKVSNGDSKHHDKNILEDGQLESDNEKKLYGLPYELDFDVLYYHKNATSIKDELSLRVSDIPSDSNNNVNPQELVSVGLNDNDELLSFFSEFLLYQYNNPNEKDPYSYNFLSEDNKLYDSFRNYLKRFMGDNIDQTLSTTIEKAYTSFTFGEKLLFKGKASYFKNLKENPNIAVQINALPENKSVITEKFLIINRKSSKPKDILTRIAIQLTSREIQQYRAQQFGSIPTFDFKNPSQDSDAYAQANPEMAELLKTLNPIRIRSIFRRREYSASFLESRLVIPMALKQTLIDPKSTIVLKTITNTIDVWNRSFDKQLEMTPVMMIFLVLNVFTIIVPIFLFFVIYKVYRNRKHPYIKAMSPQLTNLTIFGIISRILYPYFFSFVDTRFLCRISVVVNFFVNNLVYIPLFAIIFRIYYIFTNISSVSYGSKLHDRRLIIYIILALMACFGFYYGFSFFDEFNITTAGSLYEDRLMTCIYSFNKHLLFSNIYTLVLFIVMMTMTIQVRKLSKKYGDTRFILFIVLLLLSSFIFEISFNMFFQSENTNDTSPSSIVLINVHLVISIITVYFLIGNRLLFIKKHPVKNRDNFYNRDFSDLLNIVDFIPMRYNDNSSFTFFKSSLKNSNYSGNTIVKNYYKMESPNSTLHDSSGNGSTHHSLHRYLSESNMSNNMNNKSNSNIINTTNTTKMSPYSKSPTSTMMSPNSKSPTSTMMSPNSKSPTSTMMSPYSKSPTSTIMSPYSKSPSSMNQFSISKDNLNGMNYNFYNYGSSPSNNGSTIHLMNNGSNISNIYYSSNLTSHVSNINTNFGYNNFNSISDNYGKNDSSKASYFYYNKLNNNNNM